MDKILTGLPKARLLSTYTTLRNSEKILSGKRIRFSQLAGVNDPYEGMYYKGDLKQVFCFCLTAEGSESIPMWYLYGGSDGKGARLSFSNNSICKLIQGIEDGSLKLMGSDRRIVKINQDVDIVSGYVRYSAKKCEKNFENDKLLIKSDEWKYEKEYRVLLINKTERDLNYISVNCPAIFENCSLLLGPGYDAAELHISDKFSAVREKIEYQRKSNKPYLSGIRANMNFEERNQDAIIDAILKNPKILRAFINKYGSVLLKKIRVEDWVHKSPKSFQRIKELMPELQEILNEVE